MNVYQIVIILSLLGLVGWLFYYYLNITKKSKRMTEEANKFALINTIKKEVQSDGWNTNRTEQRPEPKSSGDGIFTGISQTTANQDSGVRN